MMNGREVRLRHSSEEACEQRREAGCGVGGAKGGDQEEHGSVAHVPGAEPGKRVTGAGPCTAGCKAAEEGTVHRAAAPRHDRSPQGVVLCAQTQCGPWGGRFDAVLRGRTGRPPPAPARASTQWSVPGTTRTATVHTEAGWQTAPAGDCRAGRQDRPARGGRSAERDLRGDFLGFSYGFRPGRSQHDALDALATAITGTR